MIDLQSQPPDVQSAYLELWGAQRGLKAIEAKDDLIAFTELTMPHPDAPLDPNESLYRAQYFHRSLADALMRVERGEIPRLIITFPPRHGKSELSSKKFPAWFAGRNPYQSVIVGTYNEILAGDYGRAVRSNMQSDAFKSVFPDVKLKKGSQASDRLETDMLNGMGGMLAFIGRGGTVTGRGGDLIIIDDPIKGRKEADSDLIRDELWKWYNDDIVSRSMTDKARIIIIQCMTGDTPVLMADATEKPLRDIRPGDRIATYENGEVRESTVRNWANQGPDRVFTIKMKSGATVRANARHPFLVDDGGEAKWQRTDSLKRGSVILKAIGANGRASLAPRRAVTGLPSARDCARRTTISGGGRKAFGHLRSILAPVVTRTCAIAMGLASMITTAFWPSRAVFVPCVSSLHQAGTLGHIGTTSSVSTIATMGARSGGFSAMTATSQSGTERQPKSCEPPLTTYEIGHDVVDEVFESGVEDVFDIQVDRTENFIANGLVSHNTRWHEDDLVGRLTDPTNVHYDEEEAATWKIINIPALAEENDILGRAVDEPLWPEKFSFKWLDAKRRTNPRGFSALYQQRPTPLDGDYFTSDMMVRYRRKDRPERQDMRIYAASDHAVGTKQENDPTCLLIVGVDRNDDIWLLDCWWKRAKTDVVVQHMIRLMKEWKPIFWWAEKGHISQSIGPFLKKEMRKAGVHCAISEKHPSGDKQTRAQSIQGRMASQTVRIPQDRPWGQAAVTEMLKFPNAAHDDFVDALAHIGMGLNTILGPSVKKQRAAPPALGTLGWVKAAANDEKRRRKQRLVMGGM